MSIKHEWNRLDSETRTWLLENPASLVLPQALSSRISNEEYKDVEYDVHGQVVLTRDDHDFLRDKAEAAGTIRIPDTEYRFFDTAPIPVIGTPPAGKHTQESANKGR